MAHTDSVPPAPGAEDNASGVGTLVALARSARARARRRRATCGSSRPAPRSGRTRARRTTSGRRRSSTGSSARTGSTTCRLALSLDEVGRGTRFDLHSTATAPRDERRAAAHAQATASAGSRTPPARATRDHRELARAGRARGEARRPERALPPHRLRHARPARARRVHPRTEDRLAAPEDMDLARADRRRGARLARRCGRSRSTALFGLPAHPLLLHVPGRLRADPRRSRRSPPRPAALDRHRVTLAAFSVVTLIATLLTAGAGEAFPRSARTRSRTRRRSPATRTPATRCASRWCCSRPRSSARCSRRARRPARPDRLLAIHALFWVIRTGHLGADARLEYLTKSTIS